MDTEKRNSTKNNLENRCEFCYLDSHFNLLACAIQREFFPEIQARFSTGCSLIGKPNGSKNDCDIYNSYMKNNVRLVKPALAVVSKQSEQPSSFSSTFKEGG